jgi:hypothetical protein
MDEARVWANLKALALEPGDIGKAIQAYETKTGHKPKAIGLHPQNAEKGNRCNRGLIMAREKTPLEEQETIVNFNEAEDMAVIYTHSHKWMRHLEDELGMQPIRDYGEAREYEIPKKWLRLPQKPRTASPAQKAHLAKIRKGRVKTAA